MLKCLKKKENCQQRVFYPAKLFFRIKVHIKNYPNKQKLKEFINIRTSYKKF